MDLAVNLPSEHYIRMTKPHDIYALRDPRDGKVKYVGSTVYLKGRVKHHRYYANPKQPEKTRAKMSASQKGKPKNLSPAGREALRRAGRKSARAFWKSMTPDERLAQRQTFAAAQQKRWATATKEERQQNAAHLTADREKWLAAVRRGQKKRWAKVSVEERSKMLAHARAARAVENKR